MKKITKLFLSIALLVVSANNLSAQCYVPTQAGTNLFDNPSFDGDFVNGVLGIIDDGWTNFDAKSTESPCGASDTTGSVYIKGATDGNCWPDGGVLSFNFDTAIIPGHEYQIKAMIKNETATEGAFNFNLKSSIWDLEATSTNNGSYQVAIPTTVGWEQFDVIVTAGAIATGNIEILFMSCDTNVSSTVDDLCYMDNFELFDLGPSAVPFLGASTELLSFTDIDNAPIEFTVNSGSLTENITLTAPTGITLDITTITPAESEAASGSVTVTATWDGTTSILNENITIESNRIDPVTISVVGSLDSSCFTPLYDSNMISDPTVANRSNFGGWGDVTIAVGADGACGGTSALLTTDGVNTGYPEGAAFDAGGITWVPNTNYRLRFRIKTVDGSIGLLANGIDSTFDGGDSNIMVIDTFGIWQLMDLTFTTGASAGGGFVTFNSIDGLGGLTVATATYIDNYELYNLAALSTDDFAENTKIVRAYPNPVKNVLNIDTNFEVSKVTVFDALGRTVISKNKDGNTGLKSLDVSKLSSGSYILHATIQDKIQVVKFLK